jgi:hypothetical protein
VDILLGDPLYLFEGSFNVGMHLSWILQAVRPCISFQVIKQISGVVLLLFLVMPRLVW